MNRVILSVVLLVALVATAEGWAEDYHDNVIIVLDASGSMGGNMGNTGMTRMTAAKKALEQVLLQVPESTHIGLLVFSAKGVKNEWIYPLGPRDDEALRAAINKPQPGTGTPLGKYIKIGADALLQARKKQYGYGSYRLLIVTDGEASDPKLVEKYVPEVIARGITTDVIGVDMKKSHTLATKVHSYRSAGDAEALAGAIAEVFAEVSSSGAGAAEEDAFDLLAPLPIEMGAAILNALSKLDNRAIGAAPARAVEKSVGGTKKQTAANVPGPGRAPKAPTPAPAPGSGLGCRPQPSGSSGTFMNPLNLMVAIVGGILVLFMFAKMLGGRR